MEELLRTGLGHQQQGRLAEAETAYRQILEASPQQPQVLYLLGTVAHQRGALGEAAKLIRCAIQQAPEVPDFYSNLAIVLTESGQLKDAEQACRDALRLRPQFPQALVTLADILLQRGEWNEAEAQCRKALRLVQRMPGALNTLGLALKRQGRFEEALACLEELVRATPDLSQARNNLGTVLQALGRLAPAESAYREAVRLNKQFAEAWNNLGTILRETMRFAESEQAYRRAIALQPGYAEAHSNLGELLHEDSRMDEAEGAYRKALELSPHTAKTLNNLGNALQDMGRMDEAAATYREALAQEHNLAEALRNLVQCARYSTTDHRDARAARARLSSSDVPVEDTAHLHFALGKLHDDCGDYTQAFEHYATGNRIVHAQRPFDIEAFIRFVDKVIRVFDADLFAKPPAGASDSAIPVFVIGMPRSGTSLVEQILASHPAAWGAGELPTVNALLARLRALGAGTYPELVREVKDSSLAELSAIYLDRLTRDAAPTVLRVSDKMPLNFYHLGLLARLFPRARVIHCRRDPLDTGLSLYFQYFSTGNAYAFDLKTIGAFYRQYRRLMKHWEWVLPLPIHGIDYEALVAHPQTQARALIEFTGLDWDPRCLAYHRSRRAVRTASSWQVRQPLYTRSVGRWKSYARYLGPLRDSLRKSDKPQTSSPG